MLKVNLGEIDKSRLIKLINNIVKNVNIRDIILLNGDLGSGKTFFAKQFISKLYDDEINVISPSFNIVQTYQTKSFTIWHFDLYRLKSEGELFHLGIEQAFDEGISLIEWPEMIENMLPANFIKVNLNFTRDDSKRLISLDLHGKWQDINFLNMENMNDK